MGFHQSILEKLSEVQNGQISRESLEAWLMSQLQPILDSGDPEAIYLANELDSHFVELGEGLLSSQRFDAELETIIRRESTTVRFSFGAVPITGSSHRSIVKEFEIPGKVTTLRAVLRVP